LLTRLYESSFSETILIDIDEPSPKPDNIQYSQDDTKYKKITFCSNYTRDFLIEHNIKPLIPKNIRNTKKEKKVKDMNFKDNIKLQNSKFTKKENDIYNNNIGNKND
jgi:hypothetical protein